MNTDLGVATAKLRQPGTIRNHLAKLARALLVSGIGVAAMPVPAMTTASTGAGVVNPQFSPFPGQLISPVSERIRDASMAATPGVFVYRPRHRDVAYLARILAPLVSGTFVSQVHQQTIHVHPNPAGDAIVDNDVMIFRGTEIDVELIRRVLPQIDTPLADVVAHGVVYEVNRRTTDGSAFSLVLSLLDGGLSLGVKGAIEAGGGYVSFKHASLGAVLSALSTDARFKVITNPRLRIRSGRTAHFSVGEEVPTLSSVSYPGASSGPVQAVQYRSAGVIFDLAPVVREEQIEVNVRQQISDFIATDNGVNNSPTLTKREISTSVVLDDGELIMIGGLQRNRHQANRRGFGFLPHFLDAQQGDEEHTEILLLLQVSRVKPG